MKEKELNQAKTKTKEVEPGLPLDGMNNIQGPDLSPQELVKTSAKGKNGGRRSTTWSKGRDPKFNKPKGSKHAVTKVKEQLGSSWDELARYLVEEGADKAFLELSKLDKTSFLKYYLQMVEYAKPKLTRTTIDAGDKTELKIVIRKQETKSFVEDAIIVEPDNLTGSQLIENQRIEPNK